MSDITSVKVDFLREHVRVTVGVPAGAGEVHSLQAYVAYRSTSERPNAEAFTEALASAMSAAEKHVPPKSRDLDLPSVDAT